MRREWEAHRQPAGRDAGFVTVMAAPGLATRLSLTARDWG